MISLKDLYRLTPAQRESLGLWPGGWSKPPQKKAVRSDAEREYRDRVRRNKARLAHERRRGQKRQTRHDAADLRAKNLATILENERLIAEWDAADNERRRLERERRWRARLATAKRALDSGSERYRYQRMLATMRWANRGAMLNLYQEAKRLSVVTGVPHHVDHIVPLQSHWVCGLHCEQNMQILTGSENSRKGNRSWPDCPSHVRISR
jgi:hypothetical protein